MRVIVHLAAPLRPLVKDKARIRVDVEGETAGDLLLALAESHPDLVRALLDPQGALRPQVALYLGDEDVRSAGGMQAPLKAEAYVVVPVVV
jgi:sulfur-carrier protein